MVLRNLFSIIPFFLIFFIAATLNAEVYTWKDANGNTVFGDSPPESVGAVEVDLPELTIADSYPSEDDNNRKTTTQPTAGSEEQEGSETVDYERFAVKSPAKGAAVRANNGNVMVHFDLQPALQPGHGLVVYMDGKQVANGSATVYSLKAVDRGEHTVFAVLHDQNNDVLKNTQPVRFTVLRASRI